MTLARMQQRRGTSSEWSTANPVLAEGEIGYDTSTGQIRFGNGTSPWLSLIPFYPGVQAGGGGGGVGAAPTLVIAASNAPTVVKNRADVVCTGFNDDVTINGAITAVNNQIPFAGTGKIGAVVLTDGNYLLAKPILIPSKGFSIKGQGWNTILMKAATFDGTLGQGSIPALIMMAKTAVAQAACCINIEDMYLMCKNISSNGTGTAPNSTTVSGISLVVDGATNVTGTYGFPIAAADADEFNRIRGVRVENCTHGIHIGATSATNRHSFIEGCVVHTTGAGGSGFFIDTSDNEIINCTAAGDYSGASNVTGFNIAGASSIVTHCKAFYFDNSGGVGFKINASRASLTAVEAQDCNISFQVLANQASIVQARADTQVAAAIAYDLRSGASGGSFVDLYASLRQSPGAYASATLALPADGTAGQMKVQAYLDNSTNGPMTKPVSKGTGFTAVTSSGTLPTGVNADITIRGTGVYANAG